MVSFTALRCPSDDYSKCEERWHQHESGFDSYPDARNKGFVGKSVCVGVSVCVRACVSACVCVCVFVCLCEGNLPEYPKILDSTIP